MSGVLFPDLLALTATRLDVPESIRALAEKSLREVL
jgi:hypothetical protein